MKGIKTKVEKPNFVTWNRGWVAIKRHLPLILWPSLFSVAFVLLWRFILRPNGIHINNENDMPILVIGAFVGVFYAFVAAHVLSAVWSEYKRMSFALVEEDKKEFIKGRDERIPFIIHIFLVLSGLFLVLLAILFEYKDIFTGVVLIVVTTFPVVLLEIVCIQLDDPMKSIWFQENVPKKWLNEKIKMPKKN